MVAKNNLTVESYWQNDTLQSNAVNIVSLSTDSITTILKYRLYVDIIK